MSELRKTVLLERGAKGFGFTLEGPGPCYLTNVTPDGVAAGQGLRSGDRLMAVQDRNVANGAVTHAEIALAMAEAGPTLRLTVLSQGIPETNINDNQNQHNTDDQSSGLDSDSQVWKHQRKLSEHRMLESSASASSSSLRRRHASSGNGMIKSSTRTNLFDTGKNNSSSLRPILKSSHIGDSGSSSSKAFKNHNNRPAVAAGLSKQQQQQHITIPPKVSQFENLVQSYSKALETAGPSSSKIKSSANNRCGVAFRRSSSTSGGNGGGGGGRIDSNSNKGRGGFDYSCRNSDLARISGSLQTINQEIENTLRTFAAAAAADNTSIDVAVHDSNLTPAPPPLLPSYSRAANNNDDRDKNQQHRYRYQHHLSSRPSSQHHHLHRSRHHHSRTNLKSLSNRHSTSFRHRKRTSQRQNHQPDVVHHDSAILANRMMNRSRSEPDFFYVDGGVASSSKVDSTAGATFLTSGSDEDDDDSAAEEEDGNEQKEMSRGSSGGYSMSADEEEESDSDHTGRPYEAEESDSDGDSSSCYTDYMDPNLIYHCVLVYIGAVPVGIVSSNSPPSKRTIIRESLQSLKAQRAKARTVLLEVFADSVTVQNSRRETTHRLRASLILFATACAENKQYFGICTAASRHPPVSMADHAERGTSAVCHMFAADPQLHLHSFHYNYARKFGLRCSRDPESGFCLEFPYISSPILHALAYTCRNNNLNNKQTICNGDNGLKTRNAIVSDSGRDTEEPQTQSHQQTTPTGSLQGADEARDRMRRKSSSSDWRQSPAKRTQDVHFKEPYKLFGKPSHKNNQTKLRSSESPSTSTTTTTTTKGTSTMRRLEKQVTIDNPQQVTIDNQQTTSSSSASHLAGGSQKAISDQDLPSWTGRGGEWDNDVDQFRDGQGAGGQGAAAEGQGSSGNIVHNNHRRSKLITVVGGAGGTVTKAHQNSIDNISTSATAGMGSNTQTSSDFESLLQKPSLRKPFQDFLEQQFCGENLTFWVGVEEYRKASETERVRVGERLFKAHFAPDCDETVNVDSFCLQAIREAVKQKQFTPSLYDTAQYQVFHLMKFDCWPRFQKSDFANPSPSQQQQQPTTSGGDRQSSAAANKSANQGKQGSAGQAEGTKQRKSLLPWKGRLPTVIRPRNKKQEAENINPVNQPSQQLSESQPASSSLLSAKERRSGWNQKKQISMPTQVLHTVDQSGQGQTSKAPAGSAQARSKNSPILQHQHHNATTSSIHRPNSQPSAVSVSNLLSTSATNAANASGVGRGDGVGGRPGPSGTTAGGGSSSTLPKNSVNVIFPSGHRENVPLPMEIPSSTSSTSTAAPTATMNAYQWLNQVVSARYGLDNCNMTEIIDTASGKVIMEAGQTGPADCRAALDGKTVKLVPLVMFRIEMPQPPSTASANSQSHGSRHNDNNQHPQNSSSSGSQGKQSHHQPHQHQQSTSSSTTTSSSHHQSKKLVAVRARPDSQSGLVLRPVLQKYSLDLDSVVICISGTSSVLPNSAPIKRADGKKLLVLSQTQFQEWVHGDAQSSSCPTSPVEQRVVRNMSAFRGQTNSTSTDDSSSHAEHHHAILPPSITTAPVAAGAAVEGGESGGSSYTSLSNGASLMELPPKSKRHKEDEVNGTTSAEGQPHEQKQQLHNSSKHYELTANTAEISESSAGMLKFVRKSPPSTTNAVPDQQPSTSTAQVQKSPLMSAGRRTFGASLKLPSVAPANSSMTTAGGDGVEGGDGDPGGSNRKRVTLANPEELRDQMIQDQVLSELMNRADANRYDDQRVGFVSAGRDGNFELPEFLRTTTKSSTTTTIIDDDGEFVRNASNDFPAGTQTDPTLSGRVPTVAEAEHLFGVSSITSESSAGHHSGGNVSWDDPNMTNRRDLTDFGFPPTASQNIYPNNKSNNITRLLPKTSTTTAKALNPPPTTTSSSSTTQMTSSSCDISFITAPSSPQNSAASSDSVSPAAAKLLPSSTPQTLSSSMSSPTKQFLVGTSAPSENQQNNLTAVINHIHLANNTNNNNNGQSTSAVATNSPFTSSAAPTTSSTTTTTRPPPAYPGRLCATNLERGSRTPVIYLSPKSTGVGGRGAVGLGPGDSGHSRLEEATLLQVDYV